MNSKNLVKKIRKIVLETTNGNLISLYLIGSFLRNEMTKTSDIDVVGVMKPDFDFMKEVEINKILNEKIHSKHRIDLGTMNYEEFFGGVQKGSLMKHTYLSVFINFLKNAKLIYGKKLNFDKFPIKPASIEDELNYHIGIFRKYKNEFRKKDSLGPDFYFRDFIKTIFFIANLELLRNRGLKPKSYFNISKALKKEKNHIVHYSLKLRKKKIITKQEKQHWLEMAERYVKELRERTRL